MKLPSIKHPKIKHTLLCRILVYIVVIGGFSLPFFILLPIEAIHSDIKGFACLICGISLLGYIFRNFFTLMALDLVLAGLEVHSKRADSYKLPKSFEPKKLFAHLRFFGKSYTPTALEPRPRELRYRSKHPLTIYNSGIEQIIAVYETEYLTAQEYRLIVSSAKTNAKALSGTKKHKLLDKNQKRAPLNRVTVVFIIAKAIDPSLEPQLPKKVAQGGGDGFEQSTLPCVIDLQNGICFFDGLMYPSGLPGVGVAVKNRGIRLIKHRLYGVSVPKKYRLGSTVPSDYDPDMSLWELWREMRTLTVENARKLKRRFERMDDRKIIDEGDLIYIKWEKRGLMLAVERDDEHMTVRSEPVVFWTYPSKNRISKVTAKEIQALLTEHYAASGYTLTLNPNTQK